MHLISSLVLALPNCNDNPSVLPQPYVTSVFLYMNLTTYQQVVWLGRPEAESTWEQASNLPVKVVTDYEKGIEYGVEAESFTSGGETFRTLFSKPSRDDLAVPSPKCTKVNTITSTSG